MRPVLMGRGVDIQSKVNHQNLQKLQVMTLHEALTILTTHQQWRRGADIEMAEPKVITEALDIVLAYHHVGTNEMIEINKTMTAVQWLEKELKKIPFVNPKEVFEQAKEMEKQQIMEAVSFGDCRGRVTTYLTDEQYYNETYGSKGSDETKQ